MGIKGKFARGVFGISGLTILAVMAYSVGPAAAVGQIVSERGRAPNRALSKMVLPGTQDLQLIVQLSDPSVVEYLGADESRPLGLGQGVTGGRVRMDVQSQAAATHRARLAASRRAALNAIGSLPGARVEAILDTVMNAAIVRVPVESYAQVRLVAGVKKVYFSRPQKLALNAAADLQNAQGLWNKAGGEAQAGRGIKIGIIDTGIDNTNPMFVDSSLVAPPGYPKSDAGDSTFTNSKVVVARSYVSLLASRQGVQTAADEVGHGTFVAGVAAGKQVAAPLATISGMAPGAYLGNYKVFGTPGINDSTTTAAVLSAVDAAVADKMDVLNLSLGGLDYVLPAEDPEIPALENAISSGVVVVIAAGNDGPATHTISNPGGAPHAITVGSVTNSRVFANALHVTAPAPVPSNLSNIGYISGNGPTISTNIAATSVIDVQSLDGNGYACNPLPAASLSGKIGLIERGPAAAGCLFSVKVGNAASAGAMAVIIYDWDPTQPLQGMGGLSGTTIPAVRITNSDGLALKSYVSNNTGLVMVQIDSVQSLTAMAETPRMISSFSAAGPAPDFGIKPDLVAVGENVYSAAQNSNPNGALYDTSRYTVSSGTSFSTPMVAGAAAGLKQLFPGLSPRELKSLLMSTSTWNLTTDGVKSPKVVQAGAGMLNMGNAAAAGAVFDPTSLNFGVQSYSGTLSLSRSITIKNISSTTDQFSLSYQEVVPGVSMTFSQTNTGSLAPGATTGINVGLQTTAPNSGGFQGFVLITSAASSFTYRIPYWAGLYVPDSTRILSVAQSSTGSGTYSSLANAIAAARPGNIVEISDSGSYSAGTLGLTITTNSDGLPLHGLTIRAAAGQNPTIDGSSLADLATVTVIGVQNALIQGLTINGGTGLATGVLLVQPSTDIPVSAAVDHCNLVNSNASAADSPAGIEVDGGGTVDVTDTTITIPGGTGIFANFGTYLSVVGSTISGNGNDGVDGIQSNVQIVNSTVSNNIGVGLNLDTCTGTIDGSTIASNQVASGNSYGYGIQLSDGSFAVTNNSIDSNAGLGIGFFSSTSSGSGATAYLAGNTVHANHDYGVYANPGQNLRISGNLIKDNAGGVRLTSTTTALLVNNIIVRSTSASTGDGVEIAASSNARLVNNTIYKNALRGVVQSAGATASIFNSIVSSNVKGDIQGVSDSGIHYSLVGDRAIPTGNNLTGDPRLVNPDSDIFDLSSGSPALDAGSNSVADLPFLDYNRRLRVVPSGGNSLTGDGSVDLGAIEYNSSYPLLFSLLSNGTQPVFGDSYTTGIAVLNPGSSAASTSFTAYDPSGGFIPGSSNPATESVPPGAQKPVLGYQLFGYDASAQVLGSVMVRSLQRLAGFFLLFDPSFSRLADGTSVTDQASTDLIFMRHEFDQSGKATYALFNPGVNSANVTANLISATGSSMDAPKTAAIPPKGQYIFDFNSATSSSGYVRVQSDRPVSGLELVGNTQSLGVMGAVSPGAEARLFFPHIALNQGYTTTLGVVNSNAVTANLVLTAYGNDGQVLGTPKSLSLGPNSQLLQSAADLFGIGPGSLVTGYVIALGDHAGLQGFTMYSYSDGTHNSSAVAPVDSVPRAHLLFSHVANAVPAGPGETYQTGVALLNPYGTPIDYTIRVFNASGALVKEKSDILGPRQKVAKVLSHPTAGVGFFTDPISLGSGHIEVLSSYGLLGFELFFTEDLTQLASVPAQIGN